MYTVDDRDRVIELADVPASAVGAPLPVVLGAELTCVVLYCTQNVPSGYDSTDESVARVTFEMPYASRFGPPNDEAFAGHPLADRGLHPYGAFEVLESSWIRQLERMNSVHPSHRASMFERYRHFIFAFHDSTFECVAEGYSAEITTGSLQDVLQSMGSGWLQ
ncbi:MAG: hypothetical protein Rubg2KO_10340 [Rubricoccaceae bacterium]